MKKKKNGKAEEPAIYGKNGKREGVTPSIAMINPKFPHNVGAAIRAASCFGTKQVWFSGNRVKLDASKGYRLPREERMKGYADVELRQYDRVFEQFGPDVTPVAIELRENAELLPLFQHPEKALYVFGPEDGGLEKVTLQHCHRFVVIPTRHCVNVSAAIYLVLYDRLMKSGECPATIGEILKEMRYGFSGDDDLHEKMGLT
jgi:tRNA(Leu) C34 or U34 (ribose-2'-O)-methylase TrmL